MKNKKVLIIVLLIVIILGVLILCLLNQGKKEGTTTNFEAKIYLYTKEEGGRNTSIYIDKYRPQFVINEKEVTGDLKNTKNIESITPGKNANVTVTLVEPTFIEKNTTFYLKEGGRIIGSGTVTKVN